MELKVIDVPEMNYYSSHMANNINIPQGELLIRSPSMFLGKIKSIYNNVRLFQLR